MKGPMLLCTSKRIFHDCDYIQRTLHEGYRGLCYYTHLKEHRMRNVTISNEHCIKNVININNNEILIKREPFEYDSAGRAVQKKVKQDNNNNYKRHLDLDNTSEKKTTTKKKI